MTSFLEALPLDILGHLNELITKEDAKRLRLTNQALAVFFAPQIMHTMTFDLTASTYPRELEMLKLLALGQSLAAECTRHLKIYSLTTRKFGKGMEYSSTTGADSAMDIQELEVKKWFFKGISQLQNLESISWFPYAQEEHRWAYEAMYKLLQEFRTLRHFQISSFFLTVGIIGRPNSLSHLQIPFESLSALKSITITGIRSLDQQIIKDASRHIGQLCGLEAIYLEVPYAFTEPRHHLGSENDTPDILGTLLAQYPTNIPALRLKSIVLRNTPPLLSRSMLPHFRNLTQMRVEGIVYGENTRFYLNKLWNTLRIENIHLEYIGVTQITRGLMTYLHSYSTLKAIRLARWFDSPWPDAPGSDEFFGSLLNHKDSLEEIDIAPCMNSEIPEGRWCASAPSNAGVFAKLLRLKKARVGVKGLLLRNEPITSGLNLVINTFMTLPLMRSLRVDTEEERRSNPWASESYSNIDERVRNDVRHFIRHISIPFNTRPSTPFIIEHDFETYVPRMVQMEDMPAWVYCGDRLGPEWDDEHETHPPYFYPLDQWEDTTFGH